VYLNNLRVVAVSAVGVGITSDEAEAEKSDTTTSEDVDGVTVKRRRLTCSMESVEEKHEQMDDKICSTSARTIQSLVAFDQFPNLFIYDNHGYRC